MEVLGGIASVTQLAVYTHTAWKAFTRLYAELKGGPLAWKEHATNLKHLIQITKRISLLSEQTQLGASERIADLVYELFELAEEALRTIERANAKVFGVRWSAVGATELLNRILRSLKTKREFLLFVLSQETLIEVAAIGRKISLTQEHLEDIKMDRGNRSQEIVASGPTPKVSAYTRASVILSHTNASLSSNSK
jgi:hypothetical protein